jgi:hypothetical protein
MSVVNQIREVKGKLLAIVAPDVVQRFDVVREDVLEGKPK